jgi:superfamily II DNA or RNA helicase
MKHRDDNVLIIGTYLDQLVRIAETFKAPLITGQTSHADRERQKCSRPRSRAAA